jgi:PEP-CTERM/exosortase A-associated glycosyltransferase
LKILHVLDHSIPLHDGYSFRTRSILKMQRRLGLHTCHVTSTKHGDYLEGVEKVEDFHFYRTKPVGGFMNSIPIFNQFLVIIALKKRILNIIEIEKPDVIHAHSPSLNGMAAMMAAKKFGLPFVYEIRAFWEDAAVDNGSCKEGDFRYKLTRALENKVLKGADAITTICQGLKNDIEKRKITKREVTIIPNAVSLEQFDLIKGKKTDLENSLRLNKCKVLGFIGSFYDYEGLDLLISAMTELIKEDDSFRLLLVGGGVQEQKLKEQVALLSLDDYIIFTGRVPHDTVSDYYSLIDLLVYPRKSMRLTELVTPLKPLEAMAQGKSVLASDVDGHQELITHKINGCLFESDNVKSLTSEVLCIFDDVDLQASMKYEGRKYVEKERNWEKSVNHYLPLYKSLVQN